MKKIIVVLMMCIAIFATTVTANASVDTMATSAKVEGAAIATATACGFIPAIANAIRIEYVDEECGEVYISIFGQVYVFCYIVE